MRPKKALSSKTKKAARRYFEKFGRRPDLCYLSPATLPLPGDPLGGEEVYLDGLRLMPSPLVLPDQFWVRKSHQPKRKSRRIQG